MKLTTDTHSLSQAIALASRAVPSRTTRPILGNLLLEASGEDLRITGFNESMGIACTVPATVEQIGQVTVPARLFSDLVSRLPGGVLALDLDPETYQLSLDTLGGTYKVSTLPAEDYPAIPQPEHPLVFTMPAPDLLDRLKFVAPAVSGDESKVVLTGAHLSCSADGLDFAATDGHRLALFDGEGPTERFDVTIPGSALRAITDAFKGHQGEVTVTLDEPGSLQVLAQFEVPGYRVSTRLIDGQYPQYRKLLPEKFGSQVELDRKPVIEALERVAVLASQRNNILKLDCLEGYLVISCEAAGLGSARETLTAPLTGTPVTLAFNSDYLLEGLRAFPQDTVYLHLNTPTSPVVLQGPGPERRCLIMPVQIREQPGGQGYE